MITKELLEYVQGELAKGTALPVIQERLKNQGWMPRDIAEAMTKLGVATTEVTPPMPAPAPAPLPVVPPIQAPVQTPVQSAIPAQEMTARPVSINISPAQQPSPLRTTAPTQAPPPMQAVPASQPMPRTAMPEPSPTIASIPQSGMTMMDAQNQAPFSGSPAAVTVTESKPMPKKKSWVGALIVVVIILVLGGGAGAYAYFTGYFVSMDTVASQAFQSAREAKSGSADSTISVTLPKSASSSLLSVSSGTVTVKGSYDITDETLPKFLANITVDFGPIGGGAELRVTNKTLYGKLTDISPTLGMIAPASAYINKWFSFDYGTALSQQMVSPASAIGADFGPAALTNFTDEEKAQLLSLANNAHFITIGQKLAQEKINNVQSYHFTFDLDRPGIIKYLDDVTDYVHSIGKNNSYLSTFDLSSAKTELSYIKNFSGEEWISTSDHLPTKISISFDAVQSETDTDPIKVKFVSLFTDWNKPVTVDVPPDALPFETLLNASLGQARSQASAAKVQGVISSMRAQAALYESTAGSYKGFCKASDTQPLLSEMENNTGVTTADVTCKDGTDYYVVSAKLPDGSYNCSDSEGYAGTAIPLGTATKCTQLPTF